jgi:alkylated DNA repair dioxygenase AlkB
MAAEHQRPLFADPKRRAIPEGLKYAPDALNGFEEAELIGHFDRLNFKHFEYRGFVAARRAVSFGWRCDFNGGGFQRAEAIPDFLLSARERAAAHAAVEAEALEQISVIEYPPGAGIGWHRDRPQFGKVVGISLAASCRMRFRHQIEGGGWTRAAIELAPRSIYLLEGPARKRWQHSIPALTALRYSITLRTLTDGSSQRHT